ncbi:hypothetical protein [Streptomyces sp. NPDC088812]|uniref:hypothetical protein n=1 Tax=Streptomyces sp. NPDC088812 TaxID=3365905 RepID=UPI00380394B0
MASDPAVISGMPTYQALGLLPLPDLSSLSELQLAGRVCIWSGEALNAATAVALGERQHDGRTVYLRASRTAVSAAALGALFDHTTGDEPCPDCRQHPICETGRALNRVIRLAR